MNTETKRTATEHALRHISAEGPCSIDGIASYLCEQTVGANRENCKRLAALAIDSLIGMHLISAEGNAYDKV